MTDVFNVSRETWLNPDKVKILDGIAGSAKSSTLDAFFKAENIEYTRLTSTNKLKRDALERYGGAVYTIASGLFTNEDGCFYLEEKEIESRTIVIDEVLQTSTKVFEWVRKHVGKMNIIICTDSRQMLTPVGGLTMLEKFNEFKQEPFCELVELTETKRAVNEYSRKLFNFCYYHVGDDFPLFGYLKKTFNKVDGLENISYDPRNAYICHTNDIEKYVYDTWSLYHAYDLDLIPKGGIASKNIAISDKYPITPQKLTNKRTKSYYQISNVGTVIRYQGTEVLQGRKLYFIVESFSKVDNREFYTMLSRCKDCRDIVIVTVSVPRDDELTSFNGKPIKEKETVTATSDMELSDGTTVADHIENKKIDVKTMSEILRSAGNKNGVCFSTGGVYVDGQYIKVDYTKDRQKPKLTIQGLLNKDSEIKCSYMNSFLRTFESIQNGIDGDFVDTLTPATVKEWLDPNETAKPRTEFAYACDLFSAYSHVLAYGNIPAGHDFAQRPETLADNIYNTTIEEDNEKVDFYMYTGSTLFSFGTLLTGDIVRYVQPRATFPAVYIGSAPRLERCKMGETLIAKAYNSVESKAEVKGVHYGYLEKSYLEGLDFENGEAGAYVINKENTNQLLMVAIKSELALTTLKIREAIDGDITKKPVCVDCVYFDTEENITTVGNRIREAIPQYNFRIHDPNDKTTVFYQTYEDLKTRVENRKEREKKRNHHKKGRA